MRKDIKSSLIVRRLYRTRWFWTVRNALKDLIQKAPASYPIVDDRHELNVAEQVLISWPSDYPKPRVGLVQDRKIPPYWTKYERFLRNNRFPFEYCDIHRSDWIDASKQLDVIIWAPDLATASAIDEHKRKVFTLEIYCGKACFPTFRTLMWHEDKISQYDLLRMHNFPVIETFISHSASETFGRVQTFDYPLVAKVPIGAGSLGVELVKNRKQAVTITKSNFFINCLTNCIASSGISSLRTSPIPEARKSLRGTSR